MSIVKIILISFLIVGCSKKEVNECDEFKPRDITSKNQIEDVSYNTYMQGLCNE